MGRRESAAGVGVKWGRQNEGSGSQRRGVDGGTRLRLLEACASAKVRGTQP